MSNVWNIGSGTEAEKMPFAGSSRKVTSVSSRDAYRQDHHRNLFGTDKATPFKKKMETEWQTTQKHAYQEGLVYSGGAAGGTSGVDHTKVFMTT